jgi:hypothetical protein
MPREISLRSIFSVAVLAMLLTSVLPIRASVPDGWHLAGSVPAQYEFGDAAVHTYQGHETRFLKSKQSSVDGFGTVMLSVLADQYRGKRVRFTGFVKTQDLAGWAGLWMRIDQGRKRVGFDNMYDRGIKGTSDWKRYDVVLDVPPAATDISFGILLADAGEVWLSDAKLEAVGTDVPVTNQPADDSQ